MKLIEPPALSNVTLAGGRQFALEPILSRDMPLLGRHKSLQSQSAKSTAAARRQPSPPPPPLVCESPLFGVRRQLPVAASPAQAEQPTASCSPSTKPLASSISLTHNLASAAGSRRTGSEKKTQASRPDEKQMSARQQLELTLGSIPKQITRQQIHYAFSIMDTNADGLVNLRDLSQMLANLGVPIDEAILSHVFMSTVSKRGDHLINESEFLNWIGNFIQVSDLLAPGAQSDTSGGRAQVNSAPGARKSPLSRSSSSASRGSSVSLAAHSPEAQYVIEQQLKQRRGSGSGLALMRSLSSCSTTATQRADDGRSSDVLKSNFKPNYDELPLVEQLQEARNDLRAAFCVFDLDGDGFITIDEVQQGLKLLGETWSEQELNAVFSKCERDKLADRKKNKSTGKRTAPPAAAAGELDLPAHRGQRISIDDFVKLLL